MGSVIYDFLSESLLFDTSLQQSNYKSIPEKELQSELLKYKKFALSNINNVSEEISTTQSNLKIFGDQDYFSTQHLMQTALYLDQVILPDPIYPICQEKHSMSETMNHFLGMDSSNEIDRRALSRATLKMKELTPMVMANFLKFFPVAHYHEPNKEIPINFSANGYSDILPADILSKYHDNAIVCSLKKTDKGLQVLDSLEVGRGIAIQFKNDIEKNINIYQLFEQEVVKMNEETRIAHFQMTLPETPPAEEYFQAWVAQSINQTSKAHFDQLTLDFMLSAKFGASYLTTSNFNQSLLGSPYSEKDIQAYTSDCILNLDLPFLENVSINDLMAIKMNDGEAFEMFRRELERNFRELRLENDQNIINTKIENIVHELNDVQVTKIDQKIKEIRKGALVQTGIAIGGLAGSVATSGLSLAATLSAISNGCKSYSEYREKVKENPSYFLWKIKNA